MLPRRLHDQLLPPFSLPALHDPLAGVTAAIEHHPDAMTAADRAWLLQRIRRLRHHWARLNFPHPPRLIHADAHSNNLLPLPGGGVLPGDWDHAAIGPCEWDLIQIHYMHRRFARHTDQEIEEFTAAYGRDIRNWDGFETLLRIREISGLGPYIRRAPTQQTVRAEVTHRLATLHQVATGGGHHPSIPSRGIRCLPAFHEHTPVRHRT